jgi:argininosuccinate synthase
MTSPRDRVGRTDLVENRLVGMKSRGAYETPGGAACHRASRTRTSHRRPRNRYLQQTLAVRYAEIVYNGVWFSTQRQALDGFFNVSQQRGHWQRRPQALEGHVERHQPKSPFCSIARTWPVSPWAATTKDAEGFINLFAFQSPFAPKPKRRQQFRDPAPPLDCHPEDIRQGCLEDLQPAMSARSDA